MEATCTKLYEESYNTAKESGFYLCLDHWAAEKVKFYVLTVLEWEGKKTKTTQTNYNIYGYWLPPHRS